MIDDIHNILKNCESENEKQLIIIGCKPEVAKTLSVIVAAEQIKNFLIVSEPIKKFAVMFESLSSASIEARESLTDFSKSIQEMKIETKEKRKQNRKNWHWRGKGK